MKPPSSIYASLAGAWIYLNNTVVFDNGTIVDRLGQTGILQYTENGYMSANLITSTKPEDRPLGISYPPRSTDSDTDWMLVGRSTMSYAGEYSVEVWNKTHGTLTHGPLYMAGVQAWVGNTQKRNYTILEDGQVIRVQARTEDSRGSWTSILYWRRAPRTN